MTCLIIAAGMGSRLASLTSSKPLLPFKGKVLIEWIIAAALEAGTREFCVVTGHQGERLTDYLADLATRLDITITPVYNSNWREANGLSVLAAREQLQAPFQLLMTDHLFDPSLFADLGRQPLAAGEVLLAVDHQVESNDRINPDDVTRVQADAGRIVQIGKGLQAYNAFDTGLFACTPEIFDAIATSVDEHDDASLSGAMRVLAATGNARTFDIGNRFWMDVDDAADLRCAEDLLTPTQGMTTTYLRVHTSLETPVSGH